MNTLLLIIVILVLTTILIKLKNKENYINFNELLVDAQSDSNVKKKDILDNSINILSKGNIPMSNKTVDDALITNFVKKQLNRDDAIGAGSYDTNNNMLEYPKEKEKDAIDSKQMDYDTVIAQQNSEIKSISDRQDMTLKNLKYELLRLLEMNKTIPEIEVQRNKKSKSNI